MADCQLAYLFFGGEGTRLCLNLRSDSSSSMLFQFVQHMRHSVHWMVSCIIFVWSTEKQLQLVVLGNVLDCVCKQ